MLALRLTPWYFGVEDLLPAFGDLAIAIVVAGLFAQGHPGGVLCKVSFSGAAQARALEHRCCFGGTAPIGGACLYSLRNEVAVDSKPLASLVNEEQQNLAFVPYPEEVCTGGLHSGGGRIIVCLLLDFTAAGLIFCRLNRLKIGAKSAAFRFSSASSICSFLKMAALLM